MRICCDAGHGGQDSGAVGQGGLEEADVNLSISKMLESLLTSCGYEVEQTRTSDYYVELGTRCDIANHWHASYFISVHCNSNGPSAHGIETLYKSQAGLKLAIPVQNALMALTKEHDRGVKHRTNLAVLNATHMPAILVEVGFISHPATEAKLARPDYQGLIAEAIMLGLTQFFSEP